MHGWNSWPLFVINMVWVHFTSHAAVVCWFVLYIKLTVMKQMTQIINGPDVTFMGIDGHIPCKTFFHQLSITLQYSWSYGTDLVHKSCRVYKCRWFRCLRQLILMLLRRGFQLSWSPKWWRNLQQKDTTETELQNTQTNRTVHFLS